MQTRLVAQRAARSDTCVHCVLSRVLRAESAGMATRCLTVRLGRSEPLWLPIPGVQVYRTLRRLLQAAAAEAEGNLVKLAVIDLPGKSHVEVTATALRKRRSRVFGCAFPRHAPGTLAAGFSETLDDLG
jgi:hypothetical protein